MAAGMRTMRALHTSAACRADKHPDQQRAEDLTNSSTDDDPTAGTLGAHTAGSNPGQQQEARPVSSAQNFVTDELRLRRCCARAVDDVMGRWQLW